MNRKARILNGKGSHSFEVGEIVTLSHDDGTQMPQFTGACGKRQYVRLDDVVFVDEVEDLRFASTEALLKELSRRIGGGK